MATTLKKARSPDFLQCEEQCSAIKFQSLKFFSKIYGIYNIIADHFLDSPTFLGVAVLNTINTHEFCLECHIWLKIQNSITISHGYLWIFKILVNLNFFFTHCLACIALQTVSLKLTN